jgi:hypothetical protein
MRPPAPFPSSGQKRLRFVRSCRILSSFFDKDAAASAHILNQGVETASEICMSAHAGAVTRREDPAIEPAKSASGRFELLVRRPVQMQPTD